MKKLILVAMAIFLVPAYGSTQSGLVKVRIRDNDGLVYFFLSQPSERQGVRPACALGNYWVIRDETSATGKMQYEMLLAAQIAGKRIQVRGHEDCTRWIDGEDVNMLFIE